jgi:SM-20-related protein
MPTMPEEIRLFDLNPALDRRGLRRGFAKTGRVQIRNVMTEESARNLHRVLLQATPWGLAWHAGADGPHNIPAPQLRTMGKHAQGEIQSKLTAAMRGRDYAFFYAQYPMVHAYLQRWAPGGPHDNLVELINDKPLMELVREVTQLPSLTKADAQATLYAPGNFLALHDDSHVAEGWRVAYVLNLCAEDWRPEWGGYLNFYDAEGDIVQGFKPRFNALNLFRVPQRHAVSYVPPFAPQARFAITGWFRDR